MDSRSCWRCSSHRRNGDGDLACEQVLPWWGPSMDASFWNAAFGARVEVYVPRLFRVVAPPVVRSEILTDRVGGRGNFPNAQAFALWESAAPRTVQAPAGRWPRALGPMRFQGKGEQQVILLAQERRAVALINELPANRFARQAGIEVLDVGSWIVLLAGKRLMPMGAAWFGLEYLEATHRSSPALTRVAKRALEALARGGGDDGVGH